jgi:hypothetical protein
VTRSTGILAKQILFFDMNGSKLSDMMDRRMSDMYAEISRVSAEVYPQMQEKMCLVNSPTWMSWVMAAFSKILPKKSIEKFEMFTSTEQMWNSKWANERLIRAAVPTFLGGTFPDQEMPIELTGALRVHAPVPETTVSARSSKTITIEVPIAPASIAYNIYVVARGINCSAEFIEGTGSGEECVLPKNKKGLMLREVSKLKAEDGSQVGVWHVDTPGVVKVTFDNSYSMLRSKTIKYTIEVKDIKETATAAAAAQWRAAATEHGNKETKLSDKSV